MARGLTVKYIYIYICTILSKCNNICLDLNNIYGLICAVIFAVLCSVIYAARCSCYCINICITFVVLALTYAAICAVLCIVISAGSCVFICV